MRDLSQIGTFQKCRLALNSIKESSLYRCLEESVIRFRNRAHLGNTGIQRFAKLFVVSAIAASSKLIGISLMTKKQYMVRN